MGDNNIEKHADAHKKKKICLKQYFIVSYRKSTQRQIKWLLPSNSVHVPPLDTLLVYERECLFYILAALESDLIINLMIAIYQKYSNS